MEKMSWKQVRHNDRNGSVPSLRWGHSCCIIDDQVVYFGGYADSTYMNDLWSFNTITMEWKEIATTGDVPSQRSNCSMSYDKGNNRIIVFGGGGANKKRYNSINILDWATKEWMEILPKPNQNAPWERTYHTAELYYPYLVVFGGQGISDLDDLWIFNFLTLSWTEVPFDKASPHPCARRFHSSVRYGNEFYVIAGCYAKYRCLSDIYSIDLTSFLETGSVLNLTWKERKMKDSTFLTRWGHTSVTYQDKIYVYGGRFCNDLSDILILDPEKNIISTMKVHGDPPKARRRHSACFLGSSMMIFGGFNGQYFNDLHYINIYSNRKKSTGRKVLELEDIRGLDRMKKVQSVMVRSKKGQEVKVYVELLIDRFGSRSQMNAFLLEINQKFQTSQLQQLLLTLYRGYGQIPLAISSKFSLSLFESKQQKEYQQKKLITLQQITVIGKKKLKPIDPVIVLEDQLYSDFLINLRQQGYDNDLTFNLNNQCLIKVNRTKIALSSQYLYNILSGEYQEHTNQILIPLAEPLIFQTLLHFLSSQFIVVPKSADYRLWVKLAELAEYFSLTRLMNICEGQLISAIDENCQELLVIALDLNLTSLARACGQQIIKNMVNQDLEDYNEIFPEIGCEYLGVKREKILKQVYGLLRFDILQKKIDLEYQQAKNSSKTIDSEGDREEKQNYEAVS